MNMNTKQNINSGKEDESSGAKNVFKTKSMHAPRGGISIPISFLSAASKRKIANMRQKRRRMFVRQQEILAQYAMEGI